MRVDMVTGEVKMLNSSVNDKVIEISVIEENHSNTRFFYDSEIQIIFEGEIDDAVRELEEELQKAIRTVIEEHKQIIDEVKEEKKQVDLSEKEPPTLQEIAKQTDGMAQFRLGDRVKLMLLDTNSIPKDDLAVKCLEYNGQTGNIVFMSPYYANGKHTFIYYVRVDSDRKTFHLAEDCLEPVRVLDQY
jgi:gas vesicle protein